MNNIEHIGNFTYPYFYYPRHKDLIGKKYCVVFRIWAENESEPKWWAYYRSFNDIDKLYQSANDLQNLSMKNKPRASQDGGKTYTTLNQKFAVANLVIPNNLS